MATQQEISKRIETAKKEGFSDSQIYSALAGNNDFGQRISTAKKQGFTDAQIAKNLGLNIQNGASQPTQQAYDWKAEQQKAMLAEAKKAGKTQFWESGLLGFSDLGAGVVQGASKAADAVSSGINNVFDTNLDTGSYGRVTKQRKEISDWHNLKRQANNQGFDAGRLAGQVAGTAPIALTGGGSLAQIAGRGAITGGAIGAASFAKDSNERSNNTAMGGVGGAAGGVLGKMVAAGIAKGVNAYKGNLQSGAKELIQQGEKHSVRTSVGDVGKGPFVQRAEVQMEQIPLVGMAGFRDAQQKESAKAANAVVEALRKKMSTTDYKSLEKIQKAATNGDKNAIRIMGVVKNAGEDSSKVLQASAEIKNWRGSKLASDLYDRVGVIAGNSKVNPTKTVQAIDDVVSKDSKVAPNKELINEISSIRNKLNDPNINTNFSELRAARSRLGELVSEWGRQGKSTGGLTKIRSAIDEDIKNFALNSGKNNLISEYKRADTFYKQLQSGKDKALANSMSSAEPDQIFKTFIQFGKGDKASNFYKNLDPKGQSALRFEMANQALKKATNENKEVFSPAKFALEFERLNEPYSKVFSGADKVEMDGFVKLMRHVERAGQYAENPPTGNRAVGVLIGGTAIANAPLAIKAAGASALAKALFTTNAGKRILLAAKYAPPNSPLLTNLIEQAQMISAITGVNLGKNKSNQ